MKTGPIFQKKLPKLEGTHGPRGKRELCGTSPVLPFTPGMRYVYAVIALTPALPLESGNRPVPDKLRRTDSERWIYLRFEIEHTYPPTLEPVITPSI